MLAINTENKLNMNNFLYFHFAEIINKINYQ